MTHRILIRGICYRNPDPENENAENTGNDVDAQLNQNAENTANDVDAQLNQSSAEHDDLH